MFAYLGERNFDAAERFVVAVEENLKQLANMPGMGAIRYFNDPGLKGIRSWPVSGFQKYLILYRASDKAFEFLALIHGARDIEAALLET